MKCYAALIASKAERWVRRGIRLAIGAALMVVLGAMGVVFLLTGVAQLLQHYWFGPEFPGGGYICVGVFVIAIGIGLMLLMRGKKGG